MTRAIERERVEERIEAERGELGRALRDVAISLVFTLNLPRRIRRRPLPWAIGALGIAAFAWARHRRTERA